MSIKVNSDHELVASVSMALKENGGYCPCSLVKSEDTKCKCKEFREIEEGACHCGLFIKIKSG